jgi:hypothetical protein
MGELDVVRRALGEDDGDAGPFGDRGVVGELVGLGRGAAVGVEDRAVGEALRGLCREQGAAVLGALGEAAIGRALDRVSYGDDGQGGVAEGRNDAGDGVVVDERAGGVLDQHQVRGEPRESFKPCEDRTLARRSSADGRQQLRIGKVQARVEIAVRRVDHRQHPSHVVPPDEGSDGAGEDGRARQHAVLLGAASHALACSGGDDDDGDGFLGSHDNALPSENPPDKRRFDLLHANRF